MDNNHRQLQIRQMGDFKACCEEKEGERGDDMLGSREQKSLATLDRPLRVSSLVPETHTRVTCRRQTVIDRLQRHDGDDAEEYRVETLQASSTWPLPTVEESPCVGFTTCSSHESESPAVSNVASAMGKCGLVEGVSHTTGVDDDSQGRRIDHNLFPQTQPLPLSTPNKLKSHPSVGEENANDEMLRNQELVWENENAHRSGTSDFMQMALNPNLNEHPFPSLRDSSPGQGFVRGVTDDIFQQPGQPRRMASSPGGSNNHTFGSSPDCQKLTRKMATRRQDRGQSIRRRAASAASHPLGTTPERMQPIPFHQIHRQVHSPSSNLHDAVPTGPDRLIPQTFDRAQSQTPESPFMSLATGQSCLGRGFTSNQVRFPHLRSDRMRANSSPLQRNSHSTRHGRTLATTQHRQAGRRDTVTSSRPADGHHHLPSPSAAAEFPTTERRNVHNPIGGGTAIDGSEDKSTGTAAANRRFFGQTCSPQCTGSRTCPDSVVPNSHDAPGVSGAGSAATQLPSNVVSHPLEGDNDQVQSQRTARAVVSVPPPSVSVPVPVSVSPHPSFPLPVAEEMSQLDGLSSLSLSSVGSCHHHQNRCPSFVAGSADPHSGLNSTSRSRSRFPSSSVSAGRCASDDVESVPALASHHHHHLLHTKKLPYQALLPSSTPSPSTSRSASPTTSTSSSLASSASSLPLPVRTLANGGLSKPSGLSKPVSKNGTSRGKPSPSANSCTPSSLLPHTPTKALLSKSESHEGSAHRLVNHHNLSGKFSRSGDLAVPIFAISATSPTRSVIPGVRSRRSTLRLRSCTISGQPTQPAVLPSGSSPTPAQSLRQILLPVLPTPAVAPRPQRPTVPPVSFAYRKHSYPGCAGSIDFVNISKSPFTPPFGPVPLTAKRSVDSPLPKSKRVDKSRFHPSLVAAQVHVPASPSSIRTPVRTNTFPPMISAAPTTKGAPDLSWTTPLRDNDDRRARPTMTASISNLDLVPNPGAAHPHNLPAPPLSVAPADEQLRQRSSIPSNPPGSNINASSGHIKHQTNNTASGSSAAMSQPTNTVSNPPNMAALIDQAGSAEEALLHLWREKQTAHAHNTQLWRLVEKQRTALAALTKDVERLTREREKYRRRLKEYVSANGEPVRQSPDKLAHTDASLGAGDTSMVDVPLEKCESVSALYSQTPEPDSSPLSKMTLKEDKSVGNVGRLQRKAPPKPLILSSMVNGRNTPIDQLRRDAGEDHSEGSSNERKNSTTEISRAEPAMPERGRRRTRAEDERARTQIVLSEMGVTSTSDLVPADAQSEQSLSHNLPVSPPGPTVKPPTPAHTFGLPTGPAPSMRPAGFERASNNTATTTLSIASPTTESMLQAKLATPRMVGLPASPLPGHQHQSIASVIRNTLHVVPQTATGARFPSLSESLPVPLTAIPKSGFRDEDELDASGSPPIGSGSRRVSGSSVMQKTILEHPTSVTTAIAGLPASPRPGAPPLVLGRVLNPGHGVATESLATVLESSKSGTRDRSHSESGVLGQSVVRRTRGDHDSRFTLNTKNSDPALAREKADIGLAHFPDSLYNSLRSNNSTSLLPPEALDTIKVIVSSSRLRPSRQSMMNGGRAVEDEYVLILGVHSRDDSQQLWRVEKSAASIAALHSELADATKRARTGILPFRPIDRSLFTGHAPTKVDARRLAVDTYFSKVCAYAADGMDLLGQRRLSAYLSTDVIASECNIEAGDGGNRGPTKEGYLTKRGKNFGGWKSRYFIVQRAELRYYDVAGGACLGVVPLTEATVTAQEGRDQEDDGHNDHDGSHQYRHSFTIIESRKKARHVLCADSDSERDSWVSVLTWYTVRRDETAPAVASTSPASDAPMNMQSIRYQDTRAGEPPTVGLGPWTGLASPAVGRAPTFPLADRDRGSISSEDAGFAASALAPAPPTPAAQTSVKDKKRSVLLGLRNRIPRDARKTMTALSAPFSSSTNSSSAAPAPAPVTYPVFGVPIAEAVANAQALGVATDGLPTAVFRCLNYLRDANAELEEGIFRLSGSSQLIRSIRDRFNTVGDVVFDDTLIENDRLDVHAVAGLLKLYFRELPAPLLTNELYADFTRAMESSPEERIQDITEAVNRLPVANQTVLMRLMGYIRRVVNLDSVNRMNIRNVGIVFAPTLNIPAPLISMMVLSWEHIFASVDVFDRTVAIDEPTKTETQSLDAPDLVVSIPTPVPLGSQARAAPTSYPNVPASMSGLRPNRQTLALSPSPSRPSSRTSTKSAGVGLPSGPAPVVPKLNTTNASGPGGLMDMNFFDLDAPLGVNGIDFTPLMPTPSMTFPLATGTASKADADAIAAANRAGGSTKGMKSRSRTGLTLDVLPPQSSSSTSVSTAAPSHKSNLSTSSTSTCGSLATPVGTGSQLVPGPTSAMPSVLRSPLAATHHHHNHHRVATPPTGHRTTDPSGPVIGSSPGPAPQSSSSSSANAAAAGQSFNDRRSRRNSTLALLGIRNVSGSNQNQNQNQGQGQVQVPAVPVAPSHYQHHHYLQQQSTNLAPVVEDSPMKKSRGLFKRDKSDREGLGGSGGGAGGVNGSMAVVREEAE